MKYAIFVASMLVVSADVLAEEHATASFFQAIGADIQQSRAATRESCVAECQSLFGDRIGWDQGYVTNIPPDLYTRHFNKLWLCVRKCN